MLIYYANRQVGGRGMLDQHVPACVISVMRKIPLHMTLSAKVRNFFVD
jgi:hypothetical protein